ncbi:SH3 domain-containing protein [Kordiimonas pumila]|uniref:Uncharacterized protein n=1 Tax=Kordiimonas pumila TaxID=2161677 RepID=A0ABV7D2K6_9PROT|nr:hypothetical protein [Kordiimonas pumila]
MKKTLAIFASFVAVALLIVLTTGKGFLIWQDKEVETWEASELTPTMDDPFKIAFITCKYWMGFDILERTYEFNTRSAYKMARCPLRRKIVKKGDKLRFEETYKGYLIQYRQTGVLSATIVPPNSKFNLPKIYYVTLEEGHDILKARVRKAIDDDIEKSK